jgi:selenocysteine-specific elongation factor
LLGTEELNPGEEAWIQLELRDPVVAVRGDRYILRRPSPSETLGGGMIVDHQPKGRHKRFDEAVLKSLESLSHGSPADILLEAALGTNAAPLKEIITRSRLESQEAEFALQEVLAAGTLLLLEEGEWKVTSDTLAIALPHWNATREKVMQTVEVYHQTYPLRRGIPREELKSKLKLQPRLFNAVIKKLLTDHLLTDHLSSVAKAGHEVTFTEQEQAKVQALKRRFEQSPYSPPGIKECQAEVGEEILNALIEQGEFVSVSPDVIFRTQEYDSMVADTRRSIEQNGQITLAEVRDLFNTSRKYAQAFLEHLDSIGVTARDGDFRRLKKK